MSYQLRFERFLITLLELGDSTSRNLEFAHRKDVHVSLGEEAITEHNLLEIRRRHWDSTRIETFTKPKEAKNGADWEWHLIGQAYTLKLRVQAKRVNAMTSSASSTRSSLPENNNETSLSSRQGRPL